MNGIKDWTQIDVFSVQFLRNQNGVAVGGAEREQRKAEPIAQKTAKRMDALGASIERIRWPGSQH
jgi:hypothetical protein